MVSIADRTKYWQIYLCQGLGIGIGAGLLYVPAMALQAHYWRDRRALAMGIVITGRQILSSLMCHHAKRPAASRDLNRRRRVPHHAQPALQRQRRVRVGRKSFSVSVSRPFSDQQPDHNYQPGRALSRQAKAGYQGHHYRRSFLSRSCWVSMHKWFKVPTSTNIN
jgi:hypothetical protein